MKINEYVSKILEVAKGMENIDLFEGKAQLSKTEFRLLKEIVLEGEKGNSIISSELAKRLGITRSAVSQIVTKLEKGNIVKRVAAPDDRKIAYVQLSENAMKVFEEQLAKINAFMERVVTVFGEEKMHEFVSLYDEFAGVVNTLKKETEKNAK